MRIMAGGTGKLFSPVQGIFHSFQGVIPHRMPPLKPLLIDMATHTEFINGFIELKRIVAGMGVMTGYTAVALNNAVGKKAQ